MIQQLYEILNAAKIAFTNNGWDNLYYLAQKRVNGGEYPQTAIVIPQTQDNYTEVSPTDNKGNFAYIRTLDNAPRLGLVKIGSCNSIRATYNLRIVGVWVDNSVTDYSLIDKLLGDLNHFAAYNAQYQLGGYQLIIEPLRMLINANEIFNDELDADMGMRNLALAAIDFNLQFVLKNCNKPPEKCPVDVVTTLCN